MSLPPAIIKGLLEPALDPEEAFSWADVEARIASNTAQLWLGLKSAMVTEIEADRIHVWLAGGSLRELLNMQPWVEKAAREWGLKRATIDGRLGWDRALKSCGYVRHDGYLEKML